VAQRLVLKPVVWRLTTVTVLGREHLEHLEGPFVVVSNHTSHLDAPLVLGSLPHKLARYVAAGAAADYFFDVWWRKGLTSLFFNAFPVDRTGLRGRKGLATSLLDDGVPLLLFPEGTRSKTGEMAPFKPGAAALCVSRDVPCIPVAIVGAAEAMPATPGGRCVDAPPSTSPSASRCVRMRTRTSSSSPTELPKRWSAWSTTPRHIANGIRTYERDDAQSKAEHPRGEGTSGQ